MTDRHHAVIDQIGVLRTIEQMPIIVGVNSVELAIVGGCYADGVHVRLSSPKAATYLAAAVEAAQGKQFETSGWASVRTTVTGQGPRSSARSADLDPPQAVGRLTRASTEPSCPGQCLVRTPVTQSDPAGQPT